MAGRATAYRPAIREFGAYVDPLFRRRHSPRRINSRTQVQLPPFVRPEQQLTIERLIGCLGTMPVPHVRKNDRDRRRSEMCPQACPQTYSPRCAQNLTAAYPGDDAFRRPVRRWRWRPARRPRRAGDEAVHRSMAARQAWQQLRQRLPPPPSLCRCRATYHNVLAAPLC
jgi:hypothetical protein